LRQRTNEKIEQQVVQEDTAEDEQVETGIDVVSVKDLTHLLDILDSLGEGRLLFLLVKLVSYFESIFLKLFFPESPSLLLFLVAFSI